MDAVGPLECFSPPVRPYGSARECVAASAYCSEWVNIDGATEDGVIEPVSRENCNCSVQRLRCIID